MARYYFHLRDELGAHDEEGLDLPDLDAARAQAEKFAVEMSGASVVERRALNLDHCIEVADASGGIVATVRFGDVVRIEA